MTKQTFGIRQSKKINLILLIVMAFVMAGAYFNRPNDDLGVAKRLAGEVAPLLSRGDVDAVSELIKEFSDKNNINKIKLFDAAGNSVFDHSNEQSKDDFSLASIENGVGFVVVDWPLYSNNKNVGRIELTSSESFGGAKFYYFALLFLLSFGLYANRGAFDTKPFFCGFQIFDSRDEREHSRLFLQNEFEQMGLTIHFNSLKRLKNDGTSIVKKLSSVSVKWTRNEAAASYFSLSQISELMSRDAVILPIMPWIYREFINKHSFRMAGDNADVASFDVSSKQFLDHEFRDFIVNLASSLSVPLKSLRIEVDEVTLSRLEMDEIENSWALWSDAGIGVIVSNFGKTSLSKRIIENFNPKEIKWCLSWLRYQRYSGLSKDRIIDLKQTATDKGIVNIVYGALAEHDEALMLELEFDWLEESLVLAPDADGVAKAISPSYSICVL
jgi:EAL domain-containing protein (putative c-di-GMP-specific phosphodiesterase class I)